MLAQHEAQKAQNEFLFGQVCACIVNWGFRTPKNPVSATDYMPSEWNKTTKKKTKKQKPLTQEQLANKIRATFADVAIPNKPINTFQNGNQN